MGNDQASPAEIQEHLEGIDYPTKKQDLIRHAKKQNAPEDVVAVLNQIQDKEYGSPVDVSKAVGEVE